MSQESYNLGFEYQLRRNTVVGSTSSAANLIRTIEDIGTLINGSETYIYGNPGEGLATTAFTTGLTPPFTCRRRSGIHGTRVHRQPALQQQLVPGGSYVLSRLYGNYPGLVNTDEFTLPGRSASARRKRSASGPVRAPTPAARGTSTR